MDGARGGETRSLRLYRRLLQPAAHPLCPRVSHTRAGREASEL